MYEDKKSEKENPRGPRTKVPNKVFDLGLKSKEFASYLEFFVKGRDFTLKEWRKLEAKLLAEKHTFSENEIVEIIKSKTPQNITTGHKSCEWCYCLTFALHKHHYPKKKCNNGQVVVNICPNCHYEFHFLEKIRYRIRKDFLVEVIL